VYNPWVITQRNNVHAVKLLLLYAAIFHYFLPKECTPKLHTHTPVCLRTLCFLHELLTFDHVKWTKLMQTVEETGNDWRERRMVSKLYMDHSVKVWLDQEDPRSVQIRREGRQLWCLSLNLFNLYSQYFTKVSEGLVTSNRTSNADDLVLLATKETVL
jgi:hypothetical protein